jgi:hypothetical protein
MMKNGVGEYRYTVQKQQEFPQHRVEKNRGRIRDSRKLSWRDTGAGVQGPKNCRDQTLFSFSPLFSLHVFPIDRSH